MKWGVDGEGPNHRDEWLTKTKKCNVSLDEHIKNLTQKKGSLQLARLVHKNAVLEPKSGPNKDISSLRLQQTWHFVDRRSAPNQTLWTCSCSMTLCTKTHANPCKICHLQRAPEVSIVPALTVGQFKLLPWIWRHKVICSCGKPRCPEE